MDRVYYFSRSDLSLGDCLQLVQTRIQELKCDDSHYNLADVIEMWHIHKLADNECRLSSWTDEEYSDFVSHSAKFSPYIARYFENIDEEGLNAYASLDWEYRKSFWQIIEQFNFYDVIPPEFIKRVIEKNNDLRAILSNKRIVKKFGDVIRDSMLNNVDAACILIDKFISRSISSKTDMIFLPEKLSVEDREKIVENYLESDEPNINYVRLITQAKDIPKQFVLSAKTRLKAHRLEKKLNEQLLNDPRTVTTHFQVDVSFVDDEQTNVVSTSIENKILIIKYNRKVIRKLTSIERVVYCGEIFEWMDQRYMLNLINKSSEVFSLETLFMDKSKTAYPNYNTFKCKNDIALSQLNGLFVTLVNSDLEIERDLDYFYTHYLKEEFEYPALQIKLPKTKDGWLEKCRIIIPELDNIARQYNTYVEEGEIDLDLLQLSKPMKVKDTKSLMVSKYLETNEKNEEIKNILYLLFSSESPLCNVEVFKEKRYQSMVCMMENEVVYESYYKQRKLHAVSYLIKHNILEPKEDGAIVFVNIASINILKAVWEFGACSYWHYSIEEMKAADEMVLRGWLIKDDHLLSRAERQYFSYYTDNEEYTNGFPYRNNYVHGNTPPADDEKAHAKTYFTILRLLIILLLKVYDDLWLACRVLAIDSCNKSIS